jgi:hypothetical protein
MELVSSAFLNNLSTAESRELEGHRYPLGSPPSKFFHNPLSDFGIRSDRVERSISSAPDPITLLKYYEDVCNRYDIDAAVGLFADDGSIEINGTAYRGQAALRAAHECDRGSQTQVTFGDYTVDGDRVTCTFMTYDVLDRAVGLDGRHMCAEFTIRDGRIVRFLSLPADEQERQRHYAAKHAFHSWARTHYPDEVAKGVNIDYEAGASLTRVVQAWLTRPDRDA